MRRYARAPCSPDLLKGYIVGTVELYDVLPPMDRPLTDSPWASANQWNWLLHDPRPLTRPNRVTGRLGWWDYERRRG